MTLLRSIINILSSFIIALLILFSACRKIDKYPRRIEGDWTPVPKAAAFGSAHFTWSFDDVNFSRYQPRPGGTNLGCVKDTITEGPYKYRLDEDLLIIDRTNEFDTLKIVKLNKQKLTFRKYINGELSEVSEFRKCN
jgi:hypothetical protein